MTTSSGITWTWRALRALTAAAVLALLVVTGAPAGAQRPDGSERERHRPPSSDELCGNLLLRRGEFTPLPAPRDAVSDLRATSYSGINDRRQVVGGYYEAGSEPDAQGFYPNDAHHAVLRDKRGRTTEIEVRRSQLTLAYALNDRAQVVGQYLDDGAEPDAQGRMPAGTVHGFLWHRGKARTVDVPGAALTQPLGINDDGDIVGAYLESVDDPDPYAYYERGRLRGFVLRDGRFKTVDFPGGIGTKVSGINDHGQVVGYYDTPDARRGFLLSRGRFTRIDPPGSLTTLPSGIDERGRVVGAYLDPNGINGRGFTWTDGRYRTIVAPGPRTDSIALATNDRGDILIPSDGTYYRLPEVACGRPTGAAAASAEPLAAEPLAAEPLAAEPLAGDLPMSAEPLAGDVSP
jgi:hypothetical protein